MLTATNTREPKLSPFQSPAKSPVPTERILSVDALRGFDMFWIMGGGFIFIGLDNVFHNNFTHFIVTQLDHVEWFGFHFWDIIMPLFLFLSGVSMVFSYSKRLASDTSYKKIWKHVARRVIILWILGMIVQGKLLTYDIDKIELYSNTLQAIASGYLIATIIILYLPLRLQFVATAGLLLAFWAILALIPIGGTTALAYTSYSNVAFYVDHLILGQFHDGQDYTWIVSSLNFGAITMLGVFSGYILQSKKPMMMKFRNLVIAGVALIVLGLIWDQWHPIIKKIWTGSFVLYSGGICVLMLAAFYLAIDIYKLRFGTKWLVILGTNAIFGYVAWHLFSSAFKDIASVFLSGLKPVLGNWYDTVLYLGAFLVIFFLMKYMYNKKIFIRI